MVLAELETQKQALLRAIGDETRRLSGDDTPIVSRTWWASFFLKPATAKVMALQVLKAEIENVEFIDEIGGEVLLATAGSSPAARTASDRSSATRVSPTPDGAAATARATQGKDTIGNRIIVWKRKNKVVIQQHRGSPLTTDHQRALTNVEIFLEEINGRFSDILSLPVRDKPIILS